MGDFIDMPSPFGQCFATRLDRQRNAIIEKDIAELGDGGSVGLVYQRVVDLCNRRSRFNACESIYRKDS
jgi:hypothetical protein